MNIELNKEKQTSPSKVKIQCFNPYLGIERTLDLGDPKKKKKKVPLALLAMQVKPVRHDTEGDGGWGGERERNYERGDFNCIEQFDDENAPLEIEYFQAFRFPNKNCGAGGVLGHAACTHFSLSFFFGVIKSNGF